MRKSKNNRGRLDARSATACHPAVQGKHVDKNFSANNLQSCTMPKGRGRPPGSKDSVKRRRQARSAQEQASRAAALVKRAAADAAAKQQALLSSGQRRIAEFFGRGASAAIDADSRQDNQQASLQQEGVEEGKECAGRHPSRLLLRSSGRELLLPAPRRQ